METRNYQMVNTRTTFILGPGEAFRVETGYGNRVSTVEVERIIASVHIDENGPGRLDLAFKGVYVRKDGTAGKVNAAYIRSRFEDMPTPLQQVVTEMMAAEAAKITVTA